MEKLKDKIESDNTKLFWLALAIVIGAAALSFIILDLLSIPREVSGVLSPLFLGAISQVHRMLKEYSRRSRRAKKATSTEPATIVPLTGYWLPIHLLYFYGLLRCLALVALLGFFVIILTFGTIFTNAAPKAALIENLTLYIVIGFISISYYVGQWVGSHSTATNAKGILIVVAIILTASPLGIVLWIPIVEGIEKFNVIPTQGLGPLWSIMFSILYISVSAIFGFWRGRENCIENYIHFLLKKLAKDTRSSLIDMVYDEAQNLQDSKPKALTS